MPNVSEGRDPAIIAEIADAITNTGCRLLDIHSDSDHHRSVFTMIGDEQEIVNGAVALSERATALIDLARHHGVHPRIGAVDVIPFVPLAATPMSACVTAAQQVGNILGSRIGVPVILYGAAARSTERAALPWIRRGGLPSLAQKLMTDGPDFGPCLPHPTAGVVAVGARPFLVAFNVVLDTADVSLARAIASDLREVNGGLLGVKALGLALASRHLAQVSMNLTQVAPNYEDGSATNVLTAFREVARAAKRRGTHALESEIVGLIPRDALGDASARDLLMRTDPREQVLETRMARSCR